MWYLLLPQYSMLILIAVLFVVVLFKRFLDLADDE